MKTNAWRGEENAQKAAFNPSKGCSVAGKIRAERSAGHANLEATRKRKEKIRRTAVREGVYEGED